MDEKGQKTIVFVCTGNTCRSPMAEALMRAEIRRLRWTDVVATSAGVGVRAESDLNEKSARVLSDNGLTLPNFKSKKMTVDLLERAFLILCMTDDQRDFLRQAQMRLHGETKLNTVFSYRDITGSEIPDPYGQDLAAYQKTYEALAAATPLILERFFGVKEDEPTVPIEEKTLLLVETKPKRKAPSKRKPSQKQTEQKTTKKRSPQTGNRKKKNEKEKTK